MHLVKESTSRTQHEGQMCCSFLALTDCNRRHATFSPLLVVARNQVWQRKQTARGAHCKRELRPFAAQLNNDRDHVCEHERMRKWGS